MSPLSAAATRIALADNALNPEDLRTYRRVVHLSLKAAQGKTIPLNATTASIRAALRDAFGAGFSTVLTASEASAAGRGSQELLIVSAARAVEAYGANQSPSNMVANGNPVVDNAGWAQSGTGTTTFARSTAQTLIGPASILIDTDGGATFQGAYLLSPATPLTKAATYRVSGWCRDSVGAGTVRLFIEERSADDSSQIGKSTSGAITPSTTWQQLTSTRTCAAGSRLRVGWETVAASDRAFHVAGLCVADSAGTGLGTPDIVSGQTAHFALVFDGIQFIPELLYDALAANLSGTLSTDKDTLSHDNIQLTLS